MRSKKCQNFIIEAYTTFVPGFMVDIVETEDSFEAHLYRDGYGVKIFMVGVNKAQTTKEAFISLVDDNMCDYVVCYMEHFS